MILHVGSGKVSGSILRFVNASTECKLHVLKKTKSNGVLFLRLYE